MDDTTPTELKVATGERSKLDDAVTLLDTRLDFSPVAVATGDATPELTVPEETATVEECGSTEADDDWPVAFWETTKLDPTTSADELEVGAGETCREVLVDGTTPDVFTAEAV